MGNVLQMKNGKINVADLAKKINKKMGMNVAHDLSQSDPVSVKDWIPTGSKWLDLILSPGREAGIPVGKITELAGLSGSGKSFMAAQIAANAQKKGMFVVYFDAESAIDPEFLESAGCSKDQLLYYQATSVENVLNTMEYIMNEYGEARVLFIWDSVAATPSEKDLEGDFNPQSSMAVKPRIFSKAFPKLTIPLANTESTLLLINQLKTNISSNPMMALIEPFIAPGGKAIEYFSSLRIWLTKRKSKKSFAIDEDGIRIGSHVRCYVKKSRFGSEGRDCEFKIMWGSEIGIQDEESWLEILKRSTTPNFSVSGAWYTLTPKEGKPFKFQSKQWIEKLKDEAFRSAVIALLNEVMVEKYKS